MLSVRMTTLSPSAAASLLKRAVWMEHTGVSREGTTLRTTTLPLKSESWMSSLRLAETLKLGAGLADLEFGISDERKRTALEGDDSLTFRHVGSPANGGLTGGNGRSPGGSGQGEMARSARGDGLRVTGNGVRRPADRFGAGGPAAASLLVRAGPCLSNPSTRPSGPYRVCPGQIGLDCAQVLHLSRCLARSARGVVIRTIHFPRLTNETLATSVMDRFFGYPEGSSIWPPRWKTPST
jgi:hypothetical protein